MITKGCIMICFQSDELWGTMKRVPVHERSILARLGWTGLWICGRCRGCLLDP